MINDFGPNTEWRVAEVTCMWADALMFTALSEQERWFTYAMWPFTFQRGNCTFMGYYIVQYQEKTDDNG